MQKMGDCERKQGDFVKKGEKCRDFLKIFAKKLASFRKRQYLCTRFRKKRPPEAKKKEFFERFT